MSSTNSFYLNQSEPNKSCLLALRNIILKQHKAISETVKYGMPCFCYGSKALCYLWTDKKTKEPYILMVDGNKLIHPSLESGDRSRMKIYRVNPQADIDIDEIETIVQQAIKLHLPN